MKAEALFYDLRPVWPDCETVVTLPRIGYEDYLLPWLSKAEVIHIMVGDVHRFMVYPDRGFQIAQPCRMA